jgi:hypothetical protein
MRTKGYGNADARREEQTPMNVLQTQAVIRAYGWATKTFVQADVHLRCICVHLRFQSPSSKYDDNA